MKQIRLILVNVLIFRNLLHIEIIFLFVICIEFYFKYSVLCLIFFIYFFIKYNIWNKIDVNLNKITSNK